MAAAPPHLDPDVRLDSLDPRRGGRSFRFAGRVGVVEAYRASQVLPALRRVEAAAARGLHAVGMVAYEAAPAFDAALRTHAPVPGLPLVWFALFQQRFEAPSFAAVEKPAEPADGPALGQARPAIAEPLYRSGVERIRDWIAAGDSYQVNYTFPIDAPFAGDERALYERLCRSQRSAYCALLRLPRHSVLSASPELFFRWTGDRLELRPMKGTRPRGRWSAEDAALADELRASAKDRAENLMIVDLLRSDAGRVAEFGSVHVPRLYDVERYETVHQMTSTIRARTRPGTTLRDVFRALFPCGSVTGAPKVRTSEIIAELESRPRGVYTGAIGYVSPGEAQFSVAIRTLVLDREAGRAELAVGSGITYDSDAAAEWRECLAKAAFARVRPHDFRLLETLRHDRGGGFFLLDGHLRRLAASAERFGFACDPAAVRDALHRAVATHIENAAAAAGERPRALRVRCLLDRAGAVEVQCFALAEAAPAPVRVAFAPQPVQSADAMLYHKTTDRRIYEERAAAVPHCDEALLVNERGEVTESVRANLVAELHGELLTPPLQSGLLPGVLRERLLAEGTLRERVLRPAELRRADRLWLINSVRGWRAARLV